MDSKKIRNIVIALIVIGILAYILIKGVSGGDMHGIDVGGGGH